MSEEQTPFAAAATANPVPPAQPLPVEAVPTSPAAPAPMVIPDAVAHLVGEGKKYATPELALAALGPAQTHIDQIETENATLRAANEKSRSQEDILADWQKKIGEQAPVAPTPQASATPAVTQEAIGAMVNQQIEETAAKATRQANTNSVTEAMVKHYGTTEKAEAAYIEQAKEMGLGVSGMNNLAAASPTAALKALGITQSKPPAPATSHGSVNTEALNETPLPTTPKSVMAGASHAQQKAAWKSFAPQG